MVWLGNPAAAALARVACTSAGVGGAARGETQWGQGRVQRLRRRRTARCCRADSYTRDALLAWAGLPTAQELRPCWSYPAPHLLLPACGAWPRAACAAAPGCGTGRRQQGQAAEAEEV